MRCTACQADNPIGKKFCADCGAPLGHRCPQCGAESTANKRFCGDCGAQLQTTGAVSQGPGSHPPYPTSATPSDTRKVITVVFADLMGSTALHEPLDPESVNRVMDAYYRAVRGPVEDHGGTVVQLLGDGVLCAFGVPHVSEDDALRAVRAAVGIHQAFRDFLRAQQRLEAAIGLRIAVNTGEVVVSAEHPAGIGDPLNVAARLQQEAQDGEVLIGEATRRLVGEALTLERVGAFSLKGRAEPVTAYRVVSLDRPAHAITTPFVGRAEELRRLMQVYDRAASEQRARLAVVLGSPGQGKSRILSEIGTRLGDVATVLTASCDAAGGGTFAPIARAVLAVLGLPDGSDEAARRTAIANVMSHDASAAPVGGLSEAMPPTDNARIVDGIVRLLAGEPGSPEETFFVCRRFLTALAATRPVLLVIDDLHWAEPLLLDLVEHLVQWGTGVRLTLLIGARPELRTTRSALTTQGTLVTEVITLPGLDAAAATQLAANVIGAGALPAAVAGRVLATSEGNPLFVSELARMLVDDGVLTFANGQWTAAVDLTTLEIPPTIHALLAARIERLRPEERTVLERAAVVGRQFSRGAVAHLLDDAGPLDLCLEALRRSDFVEPDSGWLLGEPTLRFHHVLIRDAAYRRVLKETRAELHERFAQWLADRVGDAVDSDEAIGFHLEHAHQNRLQLGLLGARTTALGERAAARLGAAGRRALARDDVALAATLLGRALACLDPHDPRRGEIALDWCEALLAGGEVAAATQAIAELERFAGTSERLRAWHVCFTGQLAVLTDPQSLRATADLLAPAAETLAAAADAAGEAKAHTIHALALSRLGEIGACEAALDRALAAARRARDRRRANTVLAGAPLAALWGPSPVTRASGRCLDVLRVLRITQGAPAVEAVALRCQAVLEMLRGRTDAARRMIASSRRIVEELGIAQQILETDVFGALIHLLAGDAEAAEPGLRAAYDGLRERGLAIDAARAAALLGRALLAQDRAGEAEALSRESEALTGDDLKASIAWRGVRAEALARRGETLEAVALARAAVDIAAATDALLDHADARSSLAAALRADGQAAEAAAEEHRAVQLWEDKGATVLVERARPSMGPVGPRPAGPAADARHADVRPRIVPNAATAEVARLDAAVAAGDRGAVEAMCSGLVETVPPTFGAEASLTTWQVLLRSDAPRLRQDVLATLGDSLALCRSSMSFTAPPGTDQTEVGPQREVIVLVETDAAGCLSRIESFAADRLGEATVRLYARWAEHAAPEDRPRAAVVARAVAATRQPDPDALAGLLAPHLAFADRRRLGMGGARGADAYLLGLRSLLDAARDLVNEDEPLLASPQALLLRRRGRGTLRETGGAFEHHMLMLWIYGPDGRITHIEMFDPEHASEAFARIDALVGAPTPDPSRGNAAWRALLAGNRAWRERHWDRLLTHYHPGFQLTDRRRMTGVDLAGERFFHNLRLIFDMPGSDWHMQLIATAGDALVLTRSLLTASFSGGARAEWEHLAVQEYDACGRSVALVIFDVDDLELAYAELEARHRGNDVAAVAGTALARWLHPNAAVVAHDRLTAAFELCDWPAMRAQFAPDAQIEERRAGLRTPAVDADTAIDAIRAGVDLAVNLRTERETYALSGDRIALERQTWRGGPDEAGFETRTLSLTEADAEGRVRALVTFDWDDLGHACRDATARWIALEPALAPLLQSSEALCDALRARDEAGIRAVLADDLVYHDHRRTGFGRLAGIEAFVDSVRAGWQLTTTSSITARVHLRIEPWGSVAISHFHGTLPDGGSCERLICTLVILEGDRFRRCELFAVDAAEQALARFEECRAALSSDPLRIPPNSAVRAMGRIRELALAEDWEGLRDRCAPAYRFEDRRRLLRTEGDRDTLVANARHLGRSAWRRTSRTLLATSGDRLCLHRVRFEGNRDGGDFLVESLEVTEVDDEGNLLASVIIDCDDRRAAAGEMMERYMRGEGAQRMPASQIAFLRAIHAHDLAGMRATMDPEFTFIDHRRTGMGVIGDADEYVASVVALYEQSPDATVDVLYHVAVAEHGSLSVGRTFGTLRDGGPFESVFVRLNRYEDGRSLGGELFEIDQLERAKARFEELRRAYLARRSRT